MHSFVLQRQYLLCRACDPLAEPVAVATMPWVGSRCRGQRLREIVVVGGDYPTQTFCQTSADLRNTTRRGCCGESMKRVIGILLVLLWTAITVSVVASSQASKQAFVQLPLDCHQSRIQSGVPVRRLSDGKITRIDVCGAADSADDSFRNIPYELPQGYPRN